jgi:hypothetical protein
MILWFKNKKGGRRRAMSEVVSKKQQWGMWNTEWLDRTEKLS